MTTFILIRFSQLRKHYRDFFFPTLKIKCLTGYGITLDSCNSTTLLIKKKTHEEVENVKTGQGERWG